MRRALVRQWLDRIQTSYWFAPVAFSVVAVLLARVMTWIDARVPNSVLTYSPLVYTGTAAEARTGLIGMAGTILGTAGIVFSLLTLPMSVAAAQFGSRLLRIYLRDRTTQLVLGVYAGTFVYCITVALTIPSTTTMPQAPQLSMTLALGLTLVCFFALIALIHHMGTSLEAPNVVSAASQELRDVIEAGETFVSESGSGDHRAPLEWWDAQLKLEGLPILATSMGYIQDIDPAVIRPLALKHNLIIRLISKPGDFVQKDEVVALVYPPHHVEPKVADVIRGSYVLGNLRTPSQDTQYGFNQMVEMALRAMSSAINDPYTALTCLSHIGAGLAYYLEKRPPGRESSGVMRGERIIYEPISFAALLDGIFNMLRRSSRENADVLLGMLDALEVAGQACQYTPECREIVRHIQMIQVESDASASIVADKQRVSDRCRQLVTKFAEPSTTSSPVEQVQLNTV